MRTPSRLSCPPAPGLKAIAALMTPAACRYKREIGLGRLLVEAEDPLDDLGADSGRETRVRADLDEA
jgi:hypothetical protein